MPCSEANLGHYCHKWTKVLWADPYRAWIFCCTLHQGAQCGQVPAHNSVASTIPAFVEGGFSGDADEECLEHG